VREAAASVPDPELPPVSLGQLGMVHDVRMEEDGRVVVELLPTFSGCPATEMMGRDVKDAIVERVDGVDDEGEILVRWLFDPVWTTERITEEGRARLKEFGIAPPTGGGAVTGGPDRAGRRSLPLSFGGASTTVGTDDPDADPAPAITCPYCDADEVEEDSPFGPTPCRASWYCNACDQPFERFKPL
jgi:ring-1,2-phenylacetyl-CoA epoxidase subunit PaaD